MVAFAMNREIPGYYFGTKRPSRHNPSPHLPRPQKLTCPPDKEKNRYFKIQPGSVAPANAAYNADNVKKRKFEEKKATASRKRQEKTKHQIKRASLFGDPLSGARLLREFGSLDLELPVKTWTSGLREKGDVPLALYPDDASIPSMLVNGDDEWSGMGVVLASTCYGFSELLPLSACR